MPRPPWAASSPTPSSPPLSHRCPSPGAVPSCAAPTRRCRLSRVVACRLPRTRQPAPTPLPRAPPCRPLPSIAAARFRSSQDDAAAEFSSPLDSRQLLSPAPPPGRRPRPQPPRTGRQPPLPASLLRRRQVADPAHGLLAPVSLAPSLPLPATDASRGGGRREKKGKLKFVPCHRSCGVPRRQDHGQTRL
ncbi:hypothetical protein DAI22_03g239200 [Oryza sativa Japonica Group]|jgi:hypothetical protein|nr:hypothetical protein DAI22_03g239200 [Oryza sativa Japonica Group]